MQAILFDLDGVLYQGESALPGAVKTLRWVQAANIPHVFVTNTSSRPRQAIVAKLAAMGMHINVDQLITPPLVAAHWLARHVSGPVALFVSAQTREEFSDCTLLDNTATSGAAAVVVGDLGEAWDYATLNRAFRLLMDGRPPLLALGMTRYWRAADGLRLDVGPMIQALCYATGLEPRVFGKPSADFFQAALAVLNVTPAQAVMVGDDLIGDVQGAQRAGLRAILVKTGKFQPSDLAGAVVPDAVLPDVSALSAWWAEQQAGSVIAS